MSIAKTIGEALLTAAVWTLYAFVLRPAILVLEILITLIEFFADIALFPFHFSVKSKEERSEK